MAYYKKKKKDTSTLKSSLSGAPIQEVILKRNNGHRRKNKNKNKNKTKQNKNCSLRFFLSVML